MDEADVLFPMCDVDQWQSRGPRTGTVKALIHRIRTAEATQPPAAPAAPASAQFSCLPIFAKRVASYGVGSRPRPALIPDGPRSHYTRVRDK